MGHALLFGLLATGAQLLPAGVAIYLLLPAGRRCAACGGETLLVRRGPLGYACSLLAFGRLQRRWCPGCGREEFVRTPLPSPLHLRPRGDPAPPLESSDLPESR